jgi:hypothetical protein
MTSSGCPAAASRCTVAVPWAVRAVDRAGIIQLPHLIHKAQQLLKQSG